MDIGFQTSQIRGPRCTCLPTFEPYLQDYRPTPMIKDYLIDLL